MVFGFSDGTSKKNGGLFGVWSGVTEGINTGAKGMGDLVGSASTYVYIAIAVVGGVLLMVAWSVASGKQDVAAIVSAAAELKKPI